MTHVTVLAHALAGDPTTPGHLLAAIAAHPTTSPYLAYTLLAHPNLPDDDAPENHDGSDPLFTLADALEAAVRLPHATARTRARVLAHTPTVALRTYIDTATDPHRAALTALAARPATGDHRTDQLVDLTVALHPATPAARHLAALTRLIALPLAAHDALCVAADVAGSTQLHQLLITQALRHPDHLRQLADLTPSALTRTALRRHADRHATGIDVRVTHLADARADAESQDASDPRIWIHTCERTGDPDLADLALDRVGSRSPGLADTIAFNAAFAGTNAARRAQVLHHTGWLPPAGTVRSGADVTLQTIQHDPRGDTAHQLATATHPRNPHARSHVRAGWARLHQHHDPTGALDPRSVRDTLPVYFALYALHPALAVAHRRLAIALLDTTSTHFAQMTLTAQQATVARLARAARTDADLRTALAATPAADLQRAADANGAFETLAAHHLQALLRPHHATLTPRTVTALLSLAGGFTGTVDELITSAAAIAT